ncbi:MAG: YqgE/AlgH family protein [Gammaproteobacteria bacterium]
MLETTYLNNHFLIATPALDNGLFEHTVIFMCEHNDNGALGIIINRALNVTLDEILKQMNIRTSKPELASWPVLYGGPVHPERGFVIHRGHSGWKSSFSIANDISVTTSPDILEAIATGDTPQHILITLGYAGWDKYQLEQEIKQNAWLSCPADIDILFNVPYEERWTRALAKLGVDANRLFSETIGNA